MYAAGQTKLKSLFSSLLKPQTAVNTNKAFRTTAHARRVGPQRIILKVSLQSVPNQFEIARFSVANSRLEINVNPGDHENVTVWLTQIQNENLGQRPKDHQATLKVMPQTNRLKISYMEKSGHVHKVEVLELK